MSLMNNQPDVNTDDNLLQIDKYGRIFSFDPATEIVRPPLMTGALMVQRQDVGVATLVSLYGTLDRATAKAFVEVMTWMREGERRSIHLDLSKLRVVDVEGMATIDQLVNADEVDSKLNNAPVDVLLESEAMTQLRRLVDGIHSHVRFAA